MTMFKEGTNRGIKGNKSLLSIIISSRLITLINYDLSDNIIEKPNFLSCVFAILILERASRAVSR